MKIVVRDSRDGMLVGPGALMAALWFQGSSLLWKIEQIDGVLVPEKGLLYDQLERIAERTREEPIGWKQLCDLTEKFFQLQDCEFQGFKSAEHANGATANKHPLMSIACVDSGLWEIETRFDDDVKSSIRAVFQSVSFEGST